MEEIKINNKILSEKWYKNVIVFVDKIGQQKIKLFIKLTMLKLKQGMRRFSYPVYHVMA